MRHLSLFLLLAVAPGVTFSQTVGRPVAGNPAIVESTDGIMQRAKKARQPASFEVPEREEPVRRPLDRAPQPYLDKETAAGPRFAAAPQSAAPAQTFGANFLGASSFSVGGGFNPPDAMGAVGPAQFIVAVNNAIITYDKSTGAADGVLNVSPGTFFSSVSSTANVSDPRIRYDRLSDRWFIVVIDRKASDNQALVAVSSGGTITASSSWSFFKFIPEPSMFADYPTLGIDANALYIGTNNFGGSSFSGTSIFVIRKSSILGTGPIVLTSFHATNEMFTPTGADNADPLATEGYVIGDDASFYSRLQLRRVSDPGGTPTLSSPVALNTPIDYVSPISVQTDSIALDGLGTRVINARFRAGHLWLTHNVGVDNTGASTTATTITRDGMRWYDITGVASGETPTFNQVGTVFQPSASNDTSQRSYWDGSINVSGQGHVVLGATAAGSLEPPSAAVTSRLANDSPNTMRDPSIYAVGATYSATSARWGDYSMTSVDPEDDMTFWTIVEYSNPETKQWSVQVLQLNAPLPATPTDCSPATIAPGSSNLSVAVTGVSSNGSGFFDPGTGFARHLTASVSGTGVTVNSVSYTDATHITLNVTAAGNAAPGARTITVTNPDGQSVTSSSIFSVEGTPVVGLPSVQTNAATSITLSSAMLNGTVTNDGGAAIDHRAFFYNDGVNPPIQIDDSSITVSGSNFSAQLSGLNATTTYSYRAYAHNSSASDNGAGAGWGFGQSVSFTTASPMPTVAAPVISPPGGTFRKKASVKLTCSTSGATIHYTTDGTTPTSASPTYVVSRKSKGISITGVGVHLFKAIGVETGFNDSPVASASFTIQ